MTTENGVDSRKRVPASIRKAAAKVVSIAIEQKSNSYICRSKSLLEKIFYMLSLGEHKETVISKSAGISRNNLRRILEKGRADIEEHVKPKNCFGYFVYYYDKIGSSPRFEALEKVKTDALKPDADPRLAIAYLKLICPRDFSYDPTGGGKVVSVTHNHNRMIVHQKAVNQILQLPPDQIDKFIANEAAVLGIDINRIEQQAGDVIEADFTQVEKESANEAGSQ